MFIITVIPIGRGIQSDTLTYFTRETLPKGSLVSIPLRNKTSFGLVIDSQAAEEKKSELKSLTYAIKKIERIESIGFLSQTFMESVQKIADYYASSIGAVLFSLLPRAILEQSAELEYKPRTKPKEIFFETLLLQSDTEERYATYKSLIREEFARDRSVFICVPTIEDLNYAVKSLEKGIERYTHALHNGISKKKIASAWKNAVSELHPVLIIATGSFLSIPRDDLGVIIIEKETSRAYKMQSRPFLDVRTVAEIIAGQNKARFILGDIFLRIETLWQEKNGLAVALSPLIFRSQTNALCELESMRIPQNSNKEKFVLLSEKLISMLKTAALHDHTFLFCSRKGLFPLTICNDCGTVVACNNCHAPVVLYGKKTQKSTHNLFVCHHCGERREAEIHCAYCNGWRLETLGIGIDKVVENLEEIFPNKEILVLDSDHVKTQKQAEKIRDIFYTTQGSIMVGTEMALPYLHEKFEYSAIISLDSFFSIPDFRIQEKIFQILLTLRSATNIKMIIQTRQEKTDIFDQAIRGNLLEFYRNEIEERKLIGYPPFTTYIKLTLAGEKTLIKKNMELIEEQMKPYELSVFEAFSPGNKGIHEIHGLITLARGMWVDSVLLAKLRTLPPECRIKIDPDTLL